MLFGFLLGASCALASDLRPLEMGFYLPAVREANPTDLKASLAVWIEELGRPFGVQVRARLYQDLDAMRRDVDARSLDFINAGGMEIAELIGPEVSIQGFARRSQSGGAGLVLLVNKTANVRTFADLRGKRVARPSQDRLAETYLESQCLRAWAAPCAGALAQVEEKREISAVHKLFFGQADAALVSVETLNLARELNPQINSRVAVLQEWHIQSLIFGMLLPHADSAYRNLILQSIEAAVKSARGRQMMELFKTENLDPVDGEALKPFRVLLRDYHDLRRSAAARKK
jgi:ABC-type phosphate/phosphonate transport system substrate-binding protein